MNNSNNISVNSRQSSISSAISSVNTKYFERKMEGAESPTSTQPNLNELAIDMFQKSSEYIEAELAVAQDDYKLLTDLNHECDMTYAGLRKIGGNLNKQLKEMTEKHAALKPYLEMIDSINESTSKLEAVAYMMDAYSKRLEAKFKSLEKR